MIKDKNKFNKEMLFVFIILYGIPAMIIIIPAIYFIIWPLIKVIVWPLIKIIWMLIALPFEAMTNINITGTEEIIHVHTDTTPLEFIFGILGSLMVLGIIVTIIKTALRK